MPRPESYTRQKEPLETVEDTISWFTGEIIPEALRRLNKIAAQTEVLTKQVRGTGPLAPVRIPRDETR